MAVTDHLSIADLGEIQIPDPADLTYGFIGLGLIGGSIAKALRKAFPECRIVAYNPSADSLELAQKDGVVNSGTQTIDGHFTECDIVFLCAPVQKNAENLSAIRPFLRPDAVLTDIGSTKKDIHEHVKRAALSGRFIGGHPMTGSERTRYVNSKAQLLENAYYILTPEKEVPIEKVALMDKIVRCMKAIPLITTLSEHDYAVAAISHVPHVVSAALVNLVRTHDDDRQLMHTIAAGGFKDITRISSSSPQMWQEICMTNSDNITSLLDDYIFILQDIRVKIQQHDKDALYSYFDSARVYRNSFQSFGSGAILNLITLRVDIADRFGMLAAVTGILSDAQISIKNLGITHNREDESGVLRLEFYQRKDQIRAAALLKAHGFTTHE